MMRTRLSNIKLLRKNKNGATTLEAAIVIPVVLVILVGVMQIAMAFYDISMTKNSIDKTARKILLLQNPTNTDITQIVSNNIYQSGNSTITAATTFETKYGSDYANITASISYALVIPFVDDLTIDKEVTSSIVINR